MLYNLNLTLSDEETEMLKEIKGGTVSEIIFDRPVENVLEYSHIGFTVLTFSDKDSCIVISQEDTNKEYPESEESNSAFQIRQDYPRFRVERSNIKNLDVFKYRIMSPCGVKVVGQPVWKSCFVNSRVESIRIIRDIASWKFGENTWNAKADIGIELLLSEKSILLVMEECKDWMYSVFLGAKNTAEIVNKFWNKNDWGLAGKVNCLYREVIEF